MKKMQKNDKTKIELNLKQKFAQNLKVKTWFQKLMNISHQYRTKIVKNLHKEQEKQNSKQKSTYPSVQKSTINNFLIKRLNLTILLSTQFLHFYLFRHILKTRFIGFLYFTNERLFDFLPISFPRIEPNFSFLRIRQKLNFSSIKFLIQIYQTKMRGISLVESVLKCCHSPISMDTNELRNVSPQISFKSIAKSKTKSHSSKISLKEISLRRSDKDIKNECTKTNHPTLGGYCSTIPEDENVDHNIDSETKYIKRVLSSPRTQTLFPSARSTVKTSPHHRSSPRSFKKKQFNQSLKMISQSSSKSMKLKEGPEKEEKQQEKVNTVRNYVEEKGVLENYGEEYLIKKRSLQKNEKKNLNNEELGQSLHTLLSIEQKKSEEKGDIKKEIKIEQSIILVDYFHPAKSKILNWGIQIPNQN